LASAVQESKEVDCGTKSNVFTTTVFATSLIKPKELNDERKRELEAAFQESYNFLAFRMCDGNSRSIQQVQLDPSTSVPNLAASVLDRQQIRRMQTESILNITNATNSEVAISPPDNTSLPPKYEAEEEDSASTVVFSVTGQCRNCAVADAGSFTLFDDAFRRSLGAQTGMQPQGSLVDFNLERILQVNKDTCLCPMGTEPGNKVDYLSENSRCCSIKI
jgi:hypothetical protein